MRKILFLLTALILPSLLFAQNAADKVNTNAVPPPIVKPAKDFIMLQFAYTNWLQKPDSIKTKSFGYSFNAYACYDFPIKRTKLSFAAGLGINVNVVYPVQTLVNTDTTSDPLHFAPDTAGYKQYKFITTYLTAPFEFRYYANSVNKDKGFKAAAGMTIGTLLGSDSKAVVDINGTSTKDKINTKRYVTPWNFAATLRVGWGHFAIFGSYNLTNVFKQDAGPVITPASAGICLTGL